MEFKEDYYLSKLPKEGMSANGIYFIKGYWDRIWKVFVRNVKNTRWKKIGESMDLTGVAGMSGDVGYEINGETLSLKAIRGTTVTADVDIQYEYVDKGEIDCSSNPNYPVAEMGDYYEVSESGKIGGENGNSVAQGKFIVCINDSDGGTKEEAENDFQIEDSDPTA